MQQPLTRYTPGREPAIAYQVEGEGGGIDVVSVTALLSHVELMAEAPALARTS
jgi:hypothetical protein